MTYTGVMISLSKEMYSSYISCVMFNAFGCFEASLATLSHPEVRPGVRFERMAAAIPPSCGEMI
jgi:hypothetical protein